MINDFIDLLVTALESTNAGMAGCQMMGIGDPSHDSGKTLSERFCYSLFALNVDIVPETFQGDFEDDIEYRLKLIQMGIPSVQIPMLRYGKTGKGKTKDLSGCRKAYAEVGVKRGEHMRILYGDVYSCGVRGRANTTAQTVKAGEAYFKHIVSPIKIGILSSKGNEVDQKLLEILKKYACKKEDSVKIKERRVKSGSTVKANRSKAV